MYDLFKGFHCTNCLYGKPGREIWIGGRLGDDQFYWYNSGKNVGPYLDWSPGEPSPAPRPCMQLWYNYQWDDTDCLFTRPYICERD